MGVENLLIIVWRSFYQTKVYCIGYHVPILQSRMVSQNGSIGIVWSLACLWCSNAIYRFIFGLKLSLRLIILSTFYHQWCWRTLVRLRSCTRASLTMKFLECLGLRVSLVSDLYKLTSLNPSLYSVSSWVTVTNTKVTDVYIHLQARYTSPDMLSLMKRCSHSRTTINIWYPNMRPAY